MKIRELFENVDDDTRPTLDDVNRIAKAINNFARDNGVTAELRQFPEASFPAIELTDLFAERLGSGSGTKVMLELTRMADEADINIYLRPSEPRNKIFYARFGFEPDPQHRSMMVRYPPYELDEAENDIAKSSTIQFKTWNNGGVPRHSFRVVYDGKIIAYGEVEKDSEWEDEHGASVQEIVVNHNYRRKGIATKIYNAIERKFNYKLHPSDDVKPDGKEFWKYRSNVNEGVKSENQKIDEALDSQPYPYKQYPPIDYGGGGQGIKRYHKYVFATDHDDLPYKVEIENHSGDICHISFGKQENKYSVFLNRGVTGTGDARKVFATVIEIVKNYVDQYHPVEIKFDAIEASRIRLYTAFINRVDRVLPDYRHRGGGWRYTSGQVRTGRGSGSFILYRTKNMPRQSTDPTYNVDSYVEGKKDVKEDFSAVSSKNTDEKIDAQERKRNLDNFLRGNHLSVPKILYHGSRSDTDFEVFKPSFGTYGTGIYLTNKPNVASDFAMGIRGGETDEKMGGRVIPLYVSMKHPFIDEYLRHPEWKKYIEDVINKNFERTHLWRREEYKPIKNNILQKLDNGTATIRDLFIDKNNNVLQDLGCNEIVETIHRSGFDGIIINRPDGSIEYVVFKPEQVKSAIGNIGTFDHNKPNINEDTTDNIYYHITPAKNVRLIMKKGLLPKIGRASLSFGETEERVYLFPSLIAAEDAVNNWLGNQEEDISLALLRVDASGIDLKSDVEWEFYTDQKIPPNRIKILSMDM